MRYVLWLLLVLSAPVNAGLFGYYHVHNQHVSRIVDHTNLLMIQTGNPQQDIHYLLARHPKAAFVLEFSAYDIEYYKYSKTFFYNAERTSIILDAVEQLIAPYKDRLFAFSIADEIETNIESLSTLQSIISDIKARPLLADVPLWVNFDNIFPWHSGTQFVIPERIDYVSLTPNYGQDCGRVLCERVRYEYLLSAVARHNQRRIGSPIKLLVIGDSWYAAPHVSDVIHAIKSRELYDFVYNIATRFGISVAGQVVFSYSAPDYGVSSSPAMQSVWREIGHEFLGGDKPGIAPECQPE